MAKFLNEGGLAYFWAKIKAKLDGKADSGHTHSEYLPLSGGKMAGELIVNGGDAAGVSKFVLETGKGQITNSGTQTLFGFLSSSQVAVGHSNYKINIRGSSSRPTYNGNDMALQSDIPTDYAASTHTHSEYAATSHTHDDRYYTETEVNTLLNKKANDYSLELYNGTGGNPKPVKFATVNYSTCNSENGVAAKISMVSGHGNGSSYAFLQDAIIKVSYTGTVSVDNFKFYGAESPTYDGAVRHYGDIFWVVDTTNKIVDFYCLMGQYARVNMTPWKRVTYSSGGTVTQYTSCTVYSSGTKVWANNSDIALQSDLANYATRDEVLNAGGATPPKTVSITLTASAWTEGTEAYQQTVTVSGGTTNSLIALQPTVAQIVALQDDGVTALVVDNNNGTFIAKALGAAPSANMTIQATITEVSSA